MGRREGANNNSNGLTTSTPWRKTGGDTHRPSDIDKPARPCLAGWASDVGQ